MVIANGCEGYVQDDPQSSIYRSILWKDDSVSTFLVWKDDETIRLVFAPAIYWFLLIFILSAPISCFLFFFFLTLIIVVSGYGVFAANWVLCARLCTNQHPTNTKVPGFSNTCIPYNTRGPLVPEDNHVSTKLFSFLFYFLFFQSFNSPRLINDRQTPVYNETHLIWSHYNI